MTSYIGVLGRMLPFKYPLSFREEYTPVYTFQQARSKRWAFAHTPYGTMPKREWTISLKALNMEYANIRQALLGAFGPGPLVFVPETAALTNVLTPAQSMLVGLDSGGPWELADGTVSMVSNLGAGPDGVTQLAHFVPVIPGKPLTVALDVMGENAELAFRFFTAPNGGLGRPVGGEVTVKAKGGLPQRLTHTVLSVPAGAAHMSLLVRKHVRCARPQVTYTRGETPWEVGGGAAEVVMTEAPAVATDHWTRGPNTLLRSVELKILEVG